MPHHNLVHLLDLEAEKIEIIEVRLRENSPIAGKKVGEIETPDRTLLISILREGTGFVPTAESELKVGDDILAVLDPVQEEELKRSWAPSRSSRLARSPAQAGGAQGRPGPRLARSKARR